MGLKAFRARSMGQSLEQESVGLKAFRARQLGII